MSSTIDVSQLLRPGLLEGVSVLLAGATVGGDATAARAGDGAASGGLGEAVLAACVELGARVSEYPLDLDGSLDLDEERIERVIDRVLADAGSVELLVLDGASLFARSGRDDVGRDDVGGDGVGGARAALQTCLDACWNMTRVLASRAFLPGGRGGRIVYLTPSPDAGEHGDAARAGLENLARTLSIEWARHNVTAVAIAPTAVAGAVSAVAVAREVAALTAYLASPAGAYFSGCLLDLRGPAAA